MRHSASAYSNGCRCDVCRTAHAVASKDYRSRNREKRLAYERSYWKAKPESRRRKEEHVCRTCGTSFRPWNSIGAYTGTYCSIACAGIAARLPASAQRGRQFVRLPTHPLANAQGRVLVYRVLLYERLGPGPHPCHWCDRMVEWVVRVGPGQARGSLSVDHLDGDFRNNDPDNLVPACNECNTLRAYIAGWKARTGKTISELEV